MADYAPGGTVTLTGAGWQAGEVVTIVVNDTGGLSWSLTQKVVADDEGRLTLAFNLPAHYVADYTVTATGAASGTATTTFTDAPFAYNYWMQESVPAGLSQVAGGAEITYTVSVQRTSTTAVTATITLTLTGSATFDAGQVPNITVSNAGKTATWKPGVLGDSLPTTIGIKATVASTAPAGTLTATVDGDGALVTSGTQFSARTHTVTDPVTRTCDFADAGSGAYASSICWFDLSGYNAITAASANGQTMRQTLPGDYTLTYRIKVGSTDAAAAAKEFPTWTGSYLGNPNSGVGGYQGITGMPAIYQRAGGTTTLALSNIGLTDSSGATVSGFALVGADAESTDDKESITWTSSVPFTSIGPLGNACGGGFTGNATTTVICTGGIGVGSKNGAAIIYSKDPTTFIQSMVGTGLQGVAFGVMVSGLQLNKRIVNKLPGDQFRISVARADGTVAATAITDPATGTAATKQVHSISAGASQAFTLSEVPIGSALAANYATTWACTKNGVSFTPTGTSATATVALNDFVECTITNTGPALTLKKTVDNTAGGVLTPDAWTLTAKSGSATAIASPPSRATGLTATVPVPAGPYTLSESSTAAGADWYAASAWLCTSAEGAPVPLNGNVVTLGAGVAATCSITNTNLVRPTIAVWTSTVGAAAGPFSFALTNTVQTVGAVSTGAADTRTQVDGNTTTGLQPFTAADFGTAVTIQEPAGSMPSGWMLASASCKNGIAIVGSLAGTTYTISASELVAGAAITCDFTNRRIAGTATWSKVDAGSTSTLLKGSEWTLTGPNYPSPGITIADCVTSSCAGPDTNPVPGQFSVPAHYGSYTLVEKTAPIGFQVDATVRSFAIATDGQVVGLGAFANMRSAVPALPLTGGASTESFLLAGLILIAAAGSAGWRQRRRLLRSQ